MKLTTRVILWIVFVYIMIISVMVVYTWKTVEVEVAHAVLNQYHEHFNSIDAIANGFFDDIAQDLVMLSESPAVRSREEDNFTSFLDADETTFQYTYGGAELQIIQLFKAYMDTHPHVNSVYMGRDNGSFVRSHPRSLPTKYDPRLRPWYTAALVDPTRVMLTPPYASLTNQDINIGSVKALVQDSNDPEPGEIFGVVGIDVTLMGLNNLFNQLRFSYDGRFYMVSEKDVVLYAKDVTALNVPYLEIEPQQTYVTVFQDGILTLEKSQTDYRLKQPIDRINGQLIAHLPIATVNSRLYDILAIRIFIVSVALLLFMLVVLILIERSVLLPIRNMQEVLLVSRLEKTPIPMNFLAKGELKEFQIAYNQLVTTLITEESELRQMTLLAIHTLASLAEKRDHETGLHIIRTQKYVELLAQAYVTRYLPDGIDENVVERWVECSPLHDIGKVAIPDAILFKPGPLTEEEFAIMKEHARYGKETLERGNVGIEDQTFIQIAMNIVYSHHERWDGRGYPQGISGEQIPLEARIMSLADVYDALRSDRVYKQAYNHQTAMEIITSGRGTQFQPEIVDLFVELESSFEAISNAYKE